MSSLSDVRVIIPTRGRVNNQKTLEYLKECPFPLVIVVPSCERDLWSYVGLPVSSEIVNVPNYFNIGQIRQFIIEYVKCKFHIVIDDDLDFYYKRKKLKEIGSLLFMVQDLLKQGYVHGGVASDWRNDGSVSFVENAKAAACVFYDAEVVRAEGIRVDHLQLYEDVHFTLSLIELGYVNAVIREYYWKTPMVETSSGCGRYRTAEMYEEAARKFAADHQYVSLTRKKYPQFDREIDTTIVQWKKSLGIKAKERKYHGD